MAKAKKTLMIPDELVMNKIYFIRGQKVMIDNDLADLYDVETKRLKEMFAETLAVFRKILCLNLHKRSLNL